VAAGRDDVDSGKARLPALQGTADVAAHPLRRRLCATNAAGGCDVEGRADGCGVVLVMEVWPSGTALQGEV